MIERDKALQDVRHIPWDASEGIIGELFEIWWSNQGLPDFENFLKEKGINVIP